jgi:hypothetical protein
VTLTGKVMLIIFDDTNGLIVVNILQKGSTINSVTYCKLVEVKAKQVFAQGNLLAASTYVFPYLSVNGYIHQSTVYKVLSLLSHPRDLIPK